MTEIKKRISWIILLSVLVVSSSIETVFAAGDYSYEYKYEYSKWSEEKNTGWKIAGGQEENGTKFTTGKGSFYWANQGGPVSTVVFSANASLGYGACTIGVSMGVCSGTSKVYGEEVAVPGKSSYVKKHRYKLKVRKYVKIRTVTLWKRVKYSTGSWNKVSTATQQKVTGHDLGVKEVE